MKRILFVTTKFAPGGAEKSLLMLLHMLSERSDVEVDLLLFKKEGIFLGQLPKKIKLLEQDSSMKCLYSNFSIKNMHNFHDLKCSFIRPIATILSNKKSISYNNRSQIRWKKWYKDNLRPLKIKYDIACGYLDGESIYYIVDNVEAKIKIGWNQNDYAKLGLDEKFDIYYYNKLDFIVTLTDECQSILKEKFPSQSSKIKEIPPIVTKKFIESCANVFFPNEYYEDDYFRVISVGRLVYQKGFDMAIDACKILVDNGIKIKWYIIGDGNLKEELCQQIVDNNLENTMFLLGEKSNPYPYIKHASVFVQPSRFEGKSVILNEAKMLCKPIVATRYTTVIDQLEDGKNGIISEMSAKSLAEKIKVILENKDLLKSLKYELKNENFDDSKIKLKYEELFGLR